MKLNMNYYVDFDNTLYETAKLTSLEMETIAKTICEEKKLDFNKTFEEIKESFDSPKGNFIIFAEEMAKKYNANVDNVISKVNEVIDNSSELVFEDARRFIKRVKEKGNKVIILTYIVKGNQSQQMQKLIGSGIANEVDEIFITTELKYTLDLEYSKGIFIDDAPRDLNGLYEKNPIKVIRIRKPNNKRSKVDIDNSNIEEYVSFDDIEISE